MGLVHRFQGEGDERSSGIDRVLPLRAVGHGHPGVRLAVNHRWEKSGDSSVAFNHFNVSSSQ